MRITIRNKNNNASYEVDEGAVITENFNETLDSATVTISNCEEDIKIEPYDKVILSDSQLGNRYFCVDTYSQTMTCCIEGQEKYKYEISLFSETKILEGVILPNLTITQLQSNKRSVAEYIEQYLKEYGQKIRIKDSANNIFFGQNITFSTDSYNYFFDFECPEMQWNQPTLREVINDLMMVADCIPVVRNGLLTHIKLTDKKGTDLKNNEHINYITKSRSSADYVSEIQTNLVNVMQTSTEGIDNSSNVCEYITFDASGSNLMTSDNVVLKTQYPILRIKHLYIAFPVFPKTDNTFHNSWQKILVKQDLCHIKADSENVYSSLVYEDKEFKTKKLTRSNFNTFAQMSQYQTYCLSYSRGSNVISNFATILNRKFFNNENLYLTLMKKIVDNCCSSFVGMSVLDDSGVSHVINGVSWVDAMERWYSPVFQIEYETTAECLFRASKKNVQGNERVIIDNQTNSFVDAYNQGNLEYQKANRLGNEMLQINARYEDGYDNIIEISNFYKDSIIYQCQYQIYKNHIEVNAQATKDYILRDYFTGVKSKIRSWKIADGSEATTRHDLNKIYCELSFSKKNEIISDDIKIAKYMLSPIYDYGNIKPLNYAFAKFNLGNSSIPLNGRYYATELTSRLVGNSIVFDFGFDDNFNAGRYFDIDTFGVSLDAGIVKIETNVYGGVPISYYRYTDDNGENTQISYSLANTIKYLSGLWTGVLENGSKLPKLGAMTYNETYESMWSEFYRRPEVAPAVFNSNTKYSATLKRHKDNREITRVSTQFEIMSDTIDIEIFKQFIVREEMIRNIGASNIKIYKNNSRIIPAITVTELNSGQSASVSLNTLVSKGDIIEFRDEEERKLLRVVAQNDANSLVFYMNILKLRSENIYDNHGNIIDTIKN